MKWSTAWWGIQILAETEEDKKILEKLTNSLNPNADNSYEKGEYCVVDVNNYQEDVWSFNKDEIINAKMVVEIVR
jgi:hypothetical protein